MTNNMDSRRLLKRSINTPPPLWLLAMITLGGTLAIHMFVPALSSVSNEFHGSSSLTPLTLSAYIIGLAFAQITYGPLADNFGRRPVLVIGMALFTLASIVAFFAPVIEVLIGARFFEALGGGAGLVLGRALVQDNYHGQEAAKKLSLMNLMVMMGPGLSPLIGSALVTVTGWRSIFLLLSLLGLTNLILVLKRLPPDRSTNGRSFKEVTHHYLQLWVSRSFLGYAIGGGFATTALYAYIGSAPFIFINQLGCSPSEVGLFLALNILGAWLGALTASRLAGRTSIRHALILGNLISCVSALVFLLFIVGNALSVATVLSCMLVFSYGAGIASPMALSEAMSLAPKAAASASGLYGFLQMVIGALCASLSGIGANHALSTAIVLLAAGVIAQSSFWIAQRGTRQPEDDYEGCQVAD